MKKFFYFLNLFCFGISLIIAITDMFRGISEPPFLWFLWVIIALTWFIRCDISETQSSSYEFQIESKDIEIEHLKKLVGLYDKTFKDIRDTINNGNQQNNKSTN